MLACRDKLTEAHKAIKQLRDVRDQFTALTKRLKDRDDCKDVIESAKAIDKQLTAIEEALHQTKAKSSQDVLNFPIRLNNRMSSLASSVAAGTNRPTNQAVQLKDELSAAIDAELSKWRKVTADDLLRLNELLRGKKVPAVFAEPGR